MVTVEEVEYKGLIRDVPHRTWWSKEEDVLVPSYILRESYTQEEEGSMEMMINCNWKI